MATLTVDGAQQLQQAAPQQHYGTVDLEQPQQVPQGSVPPEQQPLVQSFHTNPVAGAYFADNPAVGANFTQSQAEHQGAAKNKTYLMIVIVVLLCLLGVCGGGFACYFRDDGFFSSDEIMKTNTEADRVLQVIFSNDPRPRAYSRTTTTGRKAWRYREQGKNELRFMQEEIISVNWSPKDFSEWHEELMELCKTCFGDGPESPSEVIALLKRMKTWNRTPYEYKKYELALREIFKESSIWGTNSQFRYEEASVTFVISQVEQMLQSHENSSINSASGFLEWAKVTIETLCQIQSEGPRSWGFGPRKVIERSREIAVPPSGGKSGSALSPLEWKKWKDILKKLYDDKRDATHTSDDSYCRQEWEPIKKQIDKLISSGKAVDEVANRWETCKQKYPNWQNWDVAHGMDMVICGVQ